MTFHNTLALLALAFFLLPSSSQQPAQPVPLRAQGSNGEITVQVLDGHTGKPVSTDTIELECLAGQDRCPGFDELLAKVGPHDPLGVFHLRLPARATILSVEKSTDEYEDCAGYDPNDLGYDVRVIEAQGVLGKNECGHPGRKVLSVWQPQPGRLVVFVHRKPWWVRIFPYC